MNSEAWRERDRRVLWHPFTQHRLWEAEAFPVIVSGRGLYLFDADGKKYLDGVSSLWLNVHGHCRREIDAAVQEQLSRIAHSTFLGASHPPGILLAEKIVSLAPPGLSRVFFSDNGSTAVEAALKMAYQYWQQGENRPAKTTFIRLANAYHGDTLGAVSAGGIPLFHEIYKPLLFPTYAVPSPYCYRCHLRDEGKGGRPSPAECIQGSGCLSELDQVLAAKSEEVAGVLIEPRVQGAAGMLVQPEGFIRGVRDLCNKYNTLMIADEVATGFGRTGFMFACQSEGVTPDLMAVGKGLSGGYLPLAATLATEEVFKKFLGATHYENTFFHGHSYTANPLACAAALASISLFEKDRTLENVRGRAEQARKRLESFRELKHVAEVRQAGLMIGVELEEDPLRRTPYDPSRMMGRQVCLAARGKGLLIRPLGDVVVLMPPLCVGEEELDKILEIARQAIREVTA